ncbi:MAG: phosphate signaling complex protein PhoU [Anaerovoracaceae bacterium]|jgi:phosphate transport system protein
MMRTKFQEQLALLNRELTSMGMLCEEAISKVTAALVTGEHQAAGKLGSIHNAIDRKEREIENLCLDLLMRQQPVARDLRMISSALKMVTDMERIGDQSRDIAEIVLMANIGKNDDKLEIEDMSKVVARMVTRSVDAFVSQDEDLALRIIASDDEADEYFDKIKNHLIELVKEKDPDGEYVLDLLMIAKYLERIGDHAVNIAEWVIFSITGQHNNEEE